MEKLGFERSIHHLQEEKIGIDLIATDRHAGIKNLMRTTYPDIKHNFDVWHFAKSGKKKLLAKIKKDAEELAPWIQSISNHLFCCQNCNTDPVLLTEMWTSILKHIVNVHVWLDGQKFHKCSHPSISEEEPHLKKWLQPASPAHLALQDVVLDKSLFKHMEQLVYSCHTGALEVYHNSLLKFCPKRLQFKYNHIASQVATRCLRS